MRSALDCETDILVVVHDQNTHRPAILAPRFASTKIVPPVDDAAIVEMHAPHHRVRRSDQRASSIEKAAVRRSDNRAGERRHSPHDG
jgi:hypothetical protein